MDKNAYLYRQKNQMKIWKGIGTIKYPNGSIYQGQTMDSLYNGKGRLTHANGDIYQGDWKDGFAHGKGTYAKVSEGVLYDGQYQNDYQHGKGVELQEFGAMKYEGTLVFSIGKKRIDWINDYNSADVFPSALVFHTKDMRVYEKYMTLVREEEDFDMFSNKGGFKQGEKFTIAIAVEKLDDESVEDILGMFPPEAAALF